MQNLFNDQTVRSNTEQVLKDFNSQSIVTQAVEGEELLSMIPFLLIKMLSI